MSKIKFLSASRGFVAVDFGVFILFSVYISPNISLDEYEAILSEMSLRIAEYGPRRCTLIGDFNAKSPLWGSSRTDAHGLAVLGMMGRFDLVPVRSESTHTFERNGYQSLIDIILHGCGVHVRAIKILREFSASDHLYLVHDIGNSLVPSPKIRTVFNEKVFARSYFKLFSLVDLLSIADRGDVDLYIDLLSQLFRSSCRLANPHLSGKKAAWWWSSGVSDKRRLVIRARRLLQRGLPEREAFQAEYRAARRNLNRAVRDSKDKSWAEFTRLVDSDPWGKPYKWVIRTLRGGTPPRKLDDRELSRVISELFITSPPSEDMERLGLDDCSDQAFVPFPEEDILSAVKSVKRRALGHDGVTSEMVRCVSTCGLPHLTHILNVCCKIGYFPIAWKLGRVVLIPKKPDSRGMVGWRPLSILSNLAKVFEYAIKERLIASVSLCSNQFGFRKGMGTIEAIDHLLSAWDDCKKRNKHCVLVALDVRNAFNMVRWDNILRALCRQRVPGYLLFIINSYLQDRCIGFYNNSDVFVRVPVFAGVPQGSVLGPLLWNVQYDGLLSLDLPTGIESIGFADDVALFVSAANVDALNARAAAAFGIVSKLYVNNGLSLAHEKRKYCTLPVERRDRGPSARCLALL